MIKGIIVFVILLLVTGGFYYYQYRIVARKRSASQEFQMVSQEYQAMTDATKNFPKAQRQFETLLANYQGTLSLEDEASAKLMLANALIATERARAVSLMKEISRNVSYPTNLRALAINTLVDDYEMAFLNPRFAKQEIFTGEGFAKLLADAEGDEALAVRKLNEWSVALFPNAIAHYRIAKWYANELHCNPRREENERNDLLLKVGEHLRAGDALLPPDARPSRRGLAYELSARALYISGAKGEEVERLFKLSQDAYREPPQTVFQSVYLRRSSLYYAAFLGREYGELRGDDIRALLKPIRDFMNTREGQEQSPRLVSFLIAARDSTNAGYPALDFNRDYTERLTKIYPEFGKIIDGLILSPIK